GGIRRADAGSFESGVLARLADLQVEGTAGVDDAAAVALEPRQHCDRQLGGEPMVAGMRGGAHPVVEDALGRWSRQVENAAVEKPVPPGKRLPIQGCRQRLEPGRVFVDYMDVRHQLLSATKER